MVQIRGGEQYSKVGGGKSCGVAVSYKCFKIISCTLVYKPILGGSGCMLPRKVLKFECCEVSIFSGTRVLE